MIYLDNAATSWPKPQSVYETLCTFLQSSGANPGRSSHRMAISAAKAIGDTRATIARLLGVNAPERIIFTANATDSLNLALLGILGPGDRVVTTSMEHNSIRRPLRALQDSGVEVITVQCPASGVVDPREFNAVANGAKLFAVTHASNVNGAIQPVAELAEIAVRAGALLLIDGAQTVGAMPVEPEKLGVDLLAFPGHKSLLGPPGTGGLYIGPRVELESFVPIRTGGTGLRSEEDRQPMALPFRYEAGTANTLGIAALGAGAMFVEETGLSSIEARHRRHADQLISGLKSIEGVRVYESGSDYAAVISFSIEGWMPAEVGSVLDQSFDIACRTGLHCAPDACATIGAGPSGTIRFSPGWFTADDDIDAAICAVAELAGSPLS